MVKRKPIKWNKENCKEAAKVCKSKSEFNKKYPGAYKESKLCGWFDEITKHFTLIGNKYKRCIYAYEFSDKCVYVGLTCNLKKRNVQHKTKTDSAVYQHIKETNEYPNPKQLTDYIDYLEASKKEGEILTEYINNGWKSLNRRDTGGLGSSFEKKKKTRKRNINGYWTLDRCKKEALKYDFRTEFINSSPTAYSIAHKNGWLDEVTKHMNYKCRQIWTKEEALREALKYNSKTDFMNGSNGCYQVCLKNGWMNDVSSHMISLVEKRKIYNKDVVKKEVSKHKIMEELKKSKDKFTRGCYWWLKKNKLLIEYKKYLNGNI